MYNLNDIKNIPCQIVAEQYGIQLKKKGNRLWGKIRNEKTSSFSINLEKNLWFDFGLHEGGSVIDLVSFIKKVTNSEAIHILAGDYGFEKDKSTEWRPLTNFQYRELGVVPERATLNFKIDFDKHSIEKLELWEKKYAIPVSELAEKYPKEYNSLIKKSGFRTIYSLRDKYFHYLEAYQYPQDNFSQKFFKKECESLEIQIKSKTELLKKAVRDEKLNLNNLLVGKNDVQESQEYKNFLKKEINEAYRDQVKNFSDFQIKNLYDLNKILEDYKKPGSYIPIEQVKNLYVELGKIMEIDAEMKGIFGKNFKIAFEKASVVNEAIRNSNIVNKNNEFKGFSKQVEKIQQI